MPLPVDFNLVTGFENCSLMLPDYQNIPLANLVDMLSQETQKFTQLMMEKKRDAEYEESKSRIQQLQAAIAARKEQHSEEDPSS